MKTVPFQGIGHEAEPEWALFFIGILIGMVLTSCGTMTHVSADGSVTIQAGFASSIQQVAVQVKPGKGGATPMVTVTQTGYDGTSVINNYTGLLSTKVVANAGVATNDSNNVLAGVKDGNATKVALQKGAPAVIAAKGTAKAGVIAARAAGKG